MTSFEQTEFTQLFMHIRLYFQLLRWRIFFFLLYLALELLICLFHVVSHLAFGHDYALFADIHCFIIYPGVWLWLRACRKHVSFCQWLGVIHYLISWWSSLLDEQTRPQSSVEKLFYVLLQLNLIQIYSLVSISHYIHEFLCFIV